MPTPIYHKLLEMFQRAGINTTTFRDPRDCGYKISGAIIPHPTIRSEDKAKRIERRLKAHILMRYGK
jgi:hypothetical protein